MPFDEHLCPLAGLSVKRSTDCTYCLVETHRRLAAALFAGHVCVCTRLDMATFE